MPFSARQVLKASELNDFSVNTVTTTGNVEVGGDLNVQGGLYNSVGALAINDNVDVDGALTTTGNITVGGTISGNGSGLTNLNASNLSSGTVASARISGSYTGITGTGALNAGSITSGFGAINNGTSGMTSNTIRLTSTTDASLTSTGHAFQIGPSNSQNIIMDNNEIMARSNGVAATLNLNFDGGDVYVGGGLTVVGRVRSEGPDGGGVMRNWQANSDLVMFGTVNMASQEYAVLTDGVNTYIGAGVGGTTHIRGPNNDTSPQITNNGTNVSITGTCLFTDIDISGTARANEFRADDYGPSDDASFTFIGDEDTGMYRPGVNQVGLTAGGLLCLNAISGTVITAAPSTATTSGYQYVLRNNTFGTLYRFTSTIEVKEQVATFDESAAIIDSLRPVTFISKFIPGQPTPDDQIDEFDPTTETDAQRMMREADLQYGFIAEEIASVGDGKLAQYEWTEDGQLKATGWKWPDLIAILTAEVKSLRARVATLESST